MDQETIVNIIKLLVKNCELPRKQKDRKIFHVFFLFAVESAVGLAVESAVGLAVGNKHRRWGCRWGKNFSGGISGGKIISSVGKKFWRWECDWWE